jgi:hypothetical protein
MDDSDGAWDTFHKMHVTRGRAKYFRIPAPECKLVVLTTAEVGELVVDRADFVESVLGIQPCDGRRMTSSRGSKGAGATPRTNWKREGLSVKPLAERVEAYKEEGLEPSESDRGDTDVVRAYGLDLPESGSPEMQRLAAKIGLFEPAEQMERKWG